ncbi:MAG: GAF domain-containing sensor histidine kinase [Candidatus Xenobia bacterium]
MRDVAVLNAIAEALSSTPDLGHALTRTLSLVTDLLELRTGWIWVRDPETGRFYQAGAQNLPPFLQDPVHMTGSRCWCIGAFEDGDLTARNVDVMECSRLRPAVKRRQTALTNGLAWHASIPLSFQGKPLGILNVAAPSWRRLSAHQLRLLSTIGYQVGMALERARLEADETRRVRIDERSRLARDLHDTLAQSLTAITLQVEAAERALERKPDLARERLQQALEVARQSLEEVRRTVTTLRALPQGIAHALEALVHSFTSRSGIPVHLELDGNMALPPEIEAELYRMAQEMLSNVERHAKAHRGEVGLRVHRGRVHLRVADDGEGFNPRARPSGHGLPGLRERARLLGGRLRITSRPGTTVEVSVPLN